MNETVPTGKIEKIEWREIEQGKENFQEIIKMLVEFDERTGRHSYAPLQECHFMRKAISVGNPENLRILVCAYPSNLYYVAARLQNEQGRVTTCWVHEDGVAAERADRRNEPEHPVHQILCMSDIFSKNPVLPRQDLDSMGDLREYMNRAHSKDQDSGNEKSLNGT
ncbi:MAG: hypothetical protein RH862_09190 [Leptospiraceae bacterium]